MKNKVWSLLLPTLLLMILPGCWDRKEIESVAIISAVSIDKITSKGLDRYRVALSIVRPSSLKGGSVQSGGVGGGPSQGNNYIISGIGTTIFDAVRNIQYRNSRIQFGGHINLFIIGERVAREGAQEYIDFLQRHKDIRFKALIFFTHGEGLDAMLAQPELEISTSKEIEDLAKLGQPYLSKGYSVDIKSFLLMLSGNGRDAVAGDLDVLTPPENSRMTPTELQQNMRPTKVVGTMGAALFKKGRLIGYLNGDETRGYLYVMGKAESGAFPIVNLPGHKKDRITILMISSKSKIKPQLKDGEINFKVNIQAEGVLYEYEGSGFKLSKSEFEMLDKSFTKEVRKMALDIINKAQHKYKADIFGFGETLYRKDPKRWEEVKANWREKYFSKAKVEVDVEGRVTNTGQTADSLPFSP